MDGPSDPEQRALQQVLAKAAAALDGGRHGEALKELQSQGGLALANPVGRNIFGEICLRMGKPIEALRAFEDALRLAPNFAEAHANRAATMLEIGRPTDALAAARTALRYNPRLAVAHFNAGMALATTQRMEDAIFAFGAAAQHRADFIEAHLNRGVALMAVGRVLEALADFRRVQALDPHSATATLGIANASRWLAERERALAAAERRLMRSPDDAAALGVKAEALASLGRFGEALAVADALVVASPSAPAAHALRFAALRGLARFADALSAADAMVALGSDNPQGHTLRALVLHDLDRANDALHALLTAHRKGANAGSYERPRAAVLAAFPDIEPFFTALALASAAVGRSQQEAGGYLDRAQAQWGLRRFDYALEDIDTAIRLAPDNPDVHMQRALILRDLDREAEAGAAVANAERAGAAGAAYHHARAIVMTDLDEPDEAERGYRSAIALQPDNPVHRHTLGCLLISRGKFAEGWSEYEWRLEDPGFSDHADRLSIAPRWQGETLTGKRLLALPEQGAGDTIQFARFIPALAARGAAVTVVARRPLVGLLQRSLAGVTVTEAITDPQPFDYQIATMSLPHVLNVELANLPGEVPYLVADPLRIAKWRERLGPDGFKVGIIWQGNPRYFHDYRRSIPLREFAQLADIAGVRLISLQAAYGLDQLDGLPRGMRVESFGDEVARNLDGFEEVAAMMANLDLIVASDTGAVHLAGALGLPVWLALGRHPDWRWMHGRTDSPWYPTMRLYRQTGRGGWSDVFAAIAAAVAEKALANAVRQD